MLEALQCFFMGHKSSTAIPFSQGVYRNCERCGMMLEVDTEQSRLSELEMRLQNMTTAYDALDAQYKAAVQSARTLAAELKTAQEQVTQLATALDVARAVFRLIDQLGLLHVDDMIEVGKERADIIYAALQAAKE